MDPIQTRKERWTNFLTLDGKRQFLNMVMVQEEIPERPRPVPGSETARIEWAWAAYLHQVEQVNWLEDDTLPFLDLLTGTEIFAKAFGCPVSYPVDNMPFALPLIQTAAEVAAVRTPELASSSLQIHFEMADELVRRAGPGVLLRPVDIQSPMDIAALIWEKADFFSAMVETPEAVLELAEKTRTLLVAFWDAWVARYGREMIAHFPEYYLPQGITLSEDEVGSVSPRMFERFFLPELTLLSQRYGGLGMHCCANARHQWKNFARIPGLRMLNLVQPVEVIQEALGVFAPVCAQMPGYLWGVDQNLRPEDFPEGAHVVFSTAVQTRREALEQVEWFHRYFG